MGRGRGLRSFLSRQTALTTVVIRERLETNKRRARNVTGGGKGRRYCQYTYITTLVAGWRNLQALDERITGRTQPSTRLCSSSSPV
ncbi:hypothetical protein TWF102_000989 [Orbilia oligospora]|uniref:Uncharacterized protein n=1 Tax=Orbilia oligospora TaxID=2813651 RepID=A0A7C8JC95_ORBOL|nr:hypothetical protein TWF102_000989 [Orbilia oligospora]KAF3087341.1 hypothetical protein TWF706_011201 [Orbilia oligospora]